jgi:peroxin-3
VLPAITRAFTLIYTLALLTMLTRVQLNLLGRRSYLSSVVSLATSTAQSTINMENNDDDSSEQVYGSDFDTNRKYLTFSWWILNRGWQEIMQRVETAVRDVCGHLSPRDLLSFDVFSQLTVEVRKKVEGAADADRKGSIWLSVLLPPTDMEDFVLRKSGVMGESATVETQTGAPLPSSTPGSLRRLLDETCDLVESPAFSHVFTLILDAGFSVLLNKKLLPGAFELSASIPEVEEMQTSKVVLLPKILSVLTRQAHAIGNGMPNEYLQEMEQVRDLEAFAAVVYSSNWENEVVQDEAPVAPARERATVSPPPESVAQSQVSGLGGDSLVVVDNEPDPSQVSFETAWERAVEPK